ncbi:MAG: ABC transporter permease [Dehalococcoidia bacterium]
MTKYIARRLVLLAPTVFLVTLIVFSLMRAMPGDAASLQIGDTASRDEIDALRRQLGLDRPLYQQYFVWAAGVLTGDLGNSHRSQQPVVDELVAAIPVSAELALAGVIVAVAVALPLGTLAATNRARHIDYLARLVALAGLSIPSFVLGTLVVLLLALWFGWLPPTGYVPLYVDPFTNVQQFVFPALVVGYRSSALMTRMVRSSLLEVLQQDYIRTAMSKGLSWPTVVTRHALRNALIPVVTLIGTQVGALLSGAVVTETIFSLPGVGRLFIEAVTQRDYAMVQVVILFIALVVSISNLIVDLLYAVVDPRVGYD